MVPDVSVDPKLEKTLTEAASRAKKTMTIKDLPGLVSNSVDVVVSVESLAKLQDKKHISNVYRVLGPGGRLVFVEPLADFSLLKGTEFDEVLFDEEVD